MQVNDDGFADFVAANSVALLRTAHLLVCDRHRAEDLLQTALARTYARWHRIRDHGAARAYVRRVLATTAVSWWRLRSFGEQPVAEPPDAEVADPTASGAERLAMWRQLGALPRQQRAVLVLRYYEDLSEADIAATLGISRGAVKSAASRGLQRLREQLEPMERELT